MSVLLKELQQRKLYLQMNIDECNIQISNEKERIKFAELGLKKGDVVKDRFNDIFKISRFEGGCFYGNKKTKNGWHKKEFYICMGKFEKVDK
jgi:hypothetical protein